jgi:hypothetical protein
MSWSTITPKIFLKQSLVLVFCLLKGQCMQWLAKELRQLCLKQPRDAPKRPSKTKRQFSSGKWQRWTSKLSKSEQQRRTFKQILMTFALRQAKPASLWLVVGNERKQKQTKI